MQLRQQTRLYSYSPEEIEVVIVDYFAIYVEPNLNRLFQIEEMKQSFLDIFQLILDSHITINDFKSALEKFLGDNNSEIKAIFNIIWRLVRGELAQTEFLLSYILKMNRHCNAAEHNAHIARTITPLLVKHLIQINAPSPSTKEESPSLSLNKSR